MKNFPKSINTKKDIEHLLTIYPVETKEYLRNLLNERKYWNNDEYIENPKAYLFQLGLTTNEAITIVGDYIEPETPEKPLTPEEQEEKELLQWRNTIDCSRLQAILALDELNLYDQIDTWINTEAPKTAKLAWKEAYRFSRNSSLFDTFGGQFNLTAVDIDNIFKLALTKEV